jgi:hypothetical protein
MGISPAQFEAMQARQLAKTNRGQPVAAKEGCERESKLHEQIAAELQRRRWYAVHSRMDQATTTQSGVCDFICAAPGGVVYWVEVKRRGAKLTKDQAITRHVLLALEHKHRVVYSFQEFLDFVGAT